jgi:peroxiredoxin Q/BCP
MLTIGKPAPSFSLPDQDGTAVDLRACKGRWVVLYFYPRDDTPGCTVEACEFTSSLPDFRALGADVFGCSADSAAAHQKFIAKYELGIRLLTDADRKVMRAYGAWGEKVMYGKTVEGVIRSTALIAPDGTLAHHWPKVRAEGHADAVRTRLAELRAGAGKAPSLLPTAKPSRKPSPPPTPRTGAKRPAKSAGKPTAAQRAARRPTAPRRKAK